MPEKNRDEISVVVDGTLIDYVRKEMAYTEIQTVRMQLANARTERDTAVSAQRRAEGRFDNLKSAMTRALTEVAPAPQGGWTASIHADDMNDVRTLIDGSQSH